MEGKQLEGAWRRELWDAHWQPILALANQRGLAKRLQLAAADGRPLTVCFGQRTRTVTLPDGKHSRIAPDGDGCGRVYCDSTGLARPSFRNYCPRCRSGRNSLQKSASAAASANADGRFPVLIHQHGQPTLAWSGKCTRSKKEYADPNPRVRRCPTCRQHHR